MNKRRVAGAVALVAALGLGACSSDASGGGGTVANDKVFTNNSGYTEVFKDEGNGKNYMYTYSEFDNANGEHCTVVTGDSEKTISISCSTKPK